jgi:hypothetical protein
MSVKGSKEMLGSCMTRIHELPVNVAVRQKLDACRQNVAHLQGEVRAYTLVELAARSSNCVPWPGIGIDAQVRPPLVVR